MFKGKRVVIFGDRDGIPGPAIETCMKAAGAEVVLTITECFIWTSAGAMDMGNQTTVKKLVDEIGGENLVVVLGAADLEVAELMAQTLTVGDPSFAGPLAGVSLRLPVYHILEPIVKKAIPAEIYGEQAGFMEMVVDTEEIGRKFKAIRETPT